MAYTTPSYRDALPQLKDRLFLTDGGLETTLIFHNEIELPYFAAFDLLKTEAGRRVLEDYFRAYTEIAVRDRTGLILESATWRANSDWGDKLGYSAAELAQANRQAVVLLSNLRREVKSPDTPLVISGCVGPRGDGYNPAFQMTAEEAEAYHGVQIRTFAETDADLVTAITMNYAEEAVGVVRAAQAVRMPVVISFTVETDGKLATGQPLEDAIRSVDEATDATPLYYMINCAHPEHFEGMLDGAWTERIRGVRANASRLSHAELDEAETLDDGDPEALAEAYSRLKVRLANLSIMGGCCGTDHRHVGAISWICKPLYS